MKILILCTGNSCRSQMAHGFLQSFNADLVVRSAGTHPAENVHPLTVEVMAESGIDISRHTPKNVSEYLTETWDYVITVCGTAQENCPFFTGKGTHRLHFGFEDPSEAVGSAEYVKSQFNRIRDEIKEVFNKFYITEIKDHIDSEIENF